MIIILSTVVALTCWLLTGGVLVYAIAAGWLDVPNDRSSHKAPMPLGGGIAIGAVIAAATAILFGMKFLDRPLAYALMAGIPLMALIGWRDDHHGLSPRIRLLVHALAGTWAVYWMGGLPTLSIGTSELGLNAVGTVLAIVGVIWAINLLNFMDGIDGLAASQGVAGSFVATVLLYLGPRDPSVYAMSAVVTAACAGFLIWNWPPARIFMGDAGSGTIGFTLAVLAIASERMNAIPLLTWAIIFMPFIFDATVTLLRRALRRENILRAHRAHAYQRAVAGGWSHARVSLGALTLQLPLALLAWSSVHWPRLLLAALVLAIIIVTFAYVAVGRINPMYARQRSVVLEPSADITPLTVPPSGRSDSRTVGPAAD